MRETMPNAILLLIILLMQPFMTAYAAMNNELPPPQYGSKQAEILIDKMLTTHGKKGLWKNRNTFSFHHSLYTLNFPIELNPWWISTEQYQHKDHRGYHYYPMEESLLVFKNGKTFFQNWKLPNPPGMMPYFNYRFVALPWLPLEKGAVLSYTGIRKLPKIEKEFHTVKLQFIEQATQTPNDYLRLFIEQDTGLLKGVEYNSTYAPLLDAMQIQGNEFGPGFHVYESYQKHAGLLFPQRYSTYFNGHKAGVHAITEISLSLPYNETLAHRAGGFDAVTAHPTQRKLQ